MNAANNGILKRLLGNQNLTVSFSEEETGDIIFRKKILPKCCARLGYLPKILTTMLM